jgi:hypothetical protein
LDVYFCLFIAGDVSGYDALALVPLGGVVLQRILKVAEVRFQGFQNHAVIHGQDVLTEMNVGDAEQG